MTTRRLLKFDPQDYSNQLECRTVKGDLTLFSCRLASAAQWVNALLERQRHLVRRPTLRTSSWEAKRRQVDVLFHSHTPTDLTQAQGAAHIGQ
jgi:hypothetical protein